MGVARNVGATDVDGFTVRGDCAQWVLQTLPLVVNAGIAVTQNQDIFLFFSDTSYKANLEPHPTNLKAAVTTCSL